MAEKMKAAVVHEFGKPLVVEEVACRSSPGTRASAMLRRLAPG